MSIIFFWSDYKNKLAALKVNLKSQAAKPDETRESSLSRRNLKTDVSRSCRNPLLCASIARWKPKGPCCSAYTLCVIFMILVSLENVKKSVLGGCTITSKAKINVFWIFFERSGPEGPWKWDQNCENHT